MARRAPGDVVGRLTLLESKRKDGRTVWHVRCECGTEKDVRSSNLGRSTLSCGCLHRERVIEMMTTHGATAGGARPPLYRVWKGMRSRCLDPNAQNYRWYGGRGITIAEVWEDFANFRVWAEEHGYAEGMELDRIDNDGLYSPENCRWVTKTTNLANRSGYLSEDVRTRLHELSEETGRSVPSLITEAVERFLTEEGR